MTIDSDRIEAACEACWPTWCQSYPMNSPWHKLMREAMGRALAAADTAAMARALAVADTAAHPKPTQDRIDAAIAAYWDSPYWADNGYVWASAERIRMSRAIAAADAQRFPLPETPAADSHAAWVKWIGNKENVGRSAETIFKDGWYAAVGSNKATIPRAVREALAEYDRANNGKLYSWSEYDDAKESLHSVMIEWLRSISGDSR